MKRVISEEGEFQADESAKAKILQWNLLQSIQGIASQPVWLELGIREESGRIRFWTGRENTHHLVRLRIICVCWKAIERF